MMLRGSMNMQREELNANNLNMNKFIISLLFVFLIQIGAVNSEPLNNNMKEINNLLQNEITGDKTPAVHYIFFNKERIIHRYSGGLANIVSGKKIDELTTYNLFSITKTFTAIAVLQLQEQGKLNINEPAAKYLTNFPYGNTITIKHLLNHTAGIPNPIPLSWIHTEQVHGSFSSTEFFDNVISKHDEADFSPNEKFKYSNLAYVLLGMIIEKVSGLKYEQYIEQNVIEKIGINPNELSFTIPQPEHHAAGYIKKWSLLNIALGLFINKSEFMENSINGWKPFKNYYVNGPSYGGLIGSANGLVKYLQAILKNDPVLINNASKTMMFTENLTKEGEPTGMSLSWYTGNLNGVKYFTHAGGGGGYYCEIRLYPEKETGSIIIFNRTGISDERYLDKVDLFLINR